MMNKAEFDRTFTKLTPRQTEVLLKILAREKDAEIAQQLHINENTVRKHIANICKLFRLGDQKEAGFYHRLDLITLIAEHRPDLFQADVPTPVVISYYRATEPDQSLATELEIALKRCDYPLFIANSNLRLASDGLQQIYAALNQCNYLVVLLSQLAAASEMITEEVRVAKQGKAKIIPILINCPFYLLNHDLRGYLRDTPIYDCQLEPDLTLLVQTIVQLIVSGQNGSPFVAFTPSLSNSVETTVSLIPQPTAEPELPKGQVELASRFYMERPGVEERCFKEVAKPGALIRIKAPRQMGKTSLTARILHHARSLNYRSIALSFQLADAEIFADLERFLQWFCAVIAHELNVPDRLADYWQKIFGSKISCKSYFERYLLANLKEPLVIGLDEVDRLFKYPEIAADFFGLLRAWHEEGKTRDIWRKLCLVVVHSTEVYVPMDLHQSPFNVGLAIDLPEFSASQIRDLALRHELAWGDTQVAQLMAMVGGHPYLVRLALYHIALQEMTLSELLEIAPTDSGLYSDHLRRHLWTLSQQPKLTQAFKKVLQTPNTVQLEPIQSFKLHSLGLVKLEGNAVTIRCHLYRLYFRNHIN